MYLLEIIYRIFPRTITEIQLQIRIPDIPGGNRIWTSNVVENQKRFTSTIGDCVESQWYRVL